MTLIGLVVFPGGGDASLIKQAATLAQPAPSARRQRLACL